MVKKSHATVPLRNRDEAIHWQYKGRRMTEMIKVDE
jgi:hypothetical protein